jgi:hypothetical protein
MLNENGLLIIIIIIFPQKIEKKLNFFLGFTCLLSAFTYLASIITFRV